jgi:putative ABC transport system substrate-binding protein
MRRRDFITLLGSGAATWSLVAHAERPGKPVIGFLGTASANGYNAFLASFREGLKATGFADGRDATIQYRWAEGHIDRLPALAADLVSRRVAVIVASGGDAPGLAAKQATDQIPIIFMSGGEPVKAGLVESLNRPGGNITGVNFIVSELIPKRLEARPKSGDGWCTSKSQLSGRRAPTTRIARSGGRKGLADTHRERRHRARL